MQDSSLSFFFFRLSSRRYGRFNGLSRKRLCGYHRHRRKQFTKKAINNFDDFHVAVCFTRWKEAKDKEEKKKVFTEFIAKKVRPSKLDDPMLDGLGIRHGPGENVPQLKFIKVIPDVIFVPTVTILAIVSAKLSRRMYLK
ncbi:unnamed protein product [Brassica rapa subsp. trilocularis]